ncbi:MAG TPA: ABC transporter ATP-binding protein [Candidatus Bathyarchaeia archaeon]|nr:ABC transporter ATP-binding protein [Candidatus Bathyarchaeia archaeon]
MDSPFFNQKENKITDIQKPAAADSRAWEDISVDAIGPPSPEIIKEDSAEVNADGRVVFIKDLKVVYNAGKTNEARALNGITLEIYPEEYVMFFGPSGCGKSTLLNVIAGLENPSEGTASVAGQDLGQLSSKKMAEFHRKKIGMIFQAYNLIPTLNVLDNIIIPQIFERVNSKKRKERGRELLQRLGLEDFARRLPQELSGGQQQRVGIARALVNDPAIILADEAVGNLDSESAENVLQILSKLNIDDKKTIISVTHNPEHLFYADRIFYMKDGMVIKTEVNRDKRKIPEKKREAGEEKKERTELDLLLQAYPDLSGMQLHTMLAPFKAKILANYLISRFEQNEIEFLEKIITSRLLGQLDKKGLLEYLMRPAESAGLGLGKQTAEKYSEIIEEVVERAEFIRQERPHLREGQADPIHLTIEALRKSLMDSYAGDLGIDQVTALDKGIEYRLLGKISSLELREYFDRPFKDGGVGLNRKTAKKFAKKLEIIFLTEYGQSEE